MTHIEDLVILSGAEGIEHALDTFKSLYDELKGETPKSQRRVSVKIDGAPAVFVWSSFPGIESPGLATKGLFAKTPKIAYNHELIDQYFGHAPDLAKKMHAMFDHIPALGIPDGEIWQGDFLYDRDSVKLKTIDDEAYYVFHPNTIVYAVPVHSELGARMEESEIGVVWHTVYTGDSLENVTPSFSAKAENLNHVPSVLSTDPYVKSIAGEVTLTAEESDTIAQKLTEAEALAQQLTSHPQYEDVINDKAFISSFFTVYQNATIKSGKKVPDAETFISNFTQWATDKIRTAAEKKIAGLKTERGKNAAQQKMEQDLQTVQEMIEENEDVLILIIELIGVLTDIKEIFTRKMDALGDFQAYLQKKSGEFQRTGQEGFAVSDIAGNVVKFVDRTEFSYANFSPDVKKGWESDRRVQESIDKDINLSLLDEKVQIELDGILQQLEEKTAAPATTASDVDTLLQDIFSRLQQASQKLTRQQITTLKHEVLTLIGDEVKIMELLDPVLNLFSTFKKELTNQLYLAFRGVDDEVLKIFLESLHTQGPIITPEILNEGKTSKVIWKDHLRERMKGIVDQEDLEALLDAMEKTFMVYKGGNAGMGKGELQYAILCGGAKPEKGDLAIPGFGELELKGATGRLKGLRAAIGSPASAYQKIVQRYTQEPELEALADQIKDPNNLTLKKRANPLYEAINAALPQDRLLTLYEDVSRIYMETLYRTAVSKGYQLDQSLITKTAEAMASGNFDRAIAYQAATQYAIYKQADEFRGILAIDTIGFVFIEEPEDLVAAAETGAIIITPASMKDTIGSAAGITVRKGR